MIHAPGLVQSDYYSRDTLLPLGGQWTEGSEAAPVVHRVRYEDYREVDGIQYPHRIVFAEGDHERTLQIEYQPNVPFERSQLEPPPGVRELAASDPDPERVYAVAIANYPMQGPASGLVTLVDAGDYACSFCGKLHTTLAELRKRYPDDLRIVSRPYMVHEKARVYAIAACVATEQHKFEALDNAIWANVPGTDLFDEAECWSKPAGCQYANQFLDRVDMGPKIFSLVADGCADSVKSGEAELNKLGVGGIPAVWVNGRYIEGAQSIETLSAMVDEQLALAKQRIAAGTDRASYYETQVLTGATMK